MKFDVFGRQMIVERQGGKWQLFRCGAEGKRAPVHEVVIPDSLAEHEIRQYLDAMFHEYATERHPDVKVLEQR